VSQPYRIGASVLALATAERRGPRAECPACGTSRWARDHDNQAPFIVSATRAVACRGAGWFRRFFMGGCERRDLHLHQSCTACGAKWMCA
jgi:hypothetical protein